MYKTINELEVSHTPTLDEKPRFGIGHVSISGRNISELADFYEKIGMRLVVDMGRMAIVELRGGTHVVIHSGEVGVNSLDLIVEDIDETWSVLDAAQANPSSIQRGSPHDRFVATDPEGNRLVINSDHSMGKV